MSCRAQGALQLIGSLRKVQLGGEALLSSSSQVWLIHRTRCEWTPCLRTRSDRSSQS